MSCIINTDRVNDACKSHVQGSLPVIAFAIAISYPVSRTLSSFSCSALTLSSFVRVACSSDDIRSLQLRSSVRTTDSS